jgi:biopolymer transport protein ExbD
MPGKGRRGLAEEEELNLVPIMNLVSILIPFLVMASSQLQIAVIDSTMPAIGEPQPQEEKEEDEDVPLQLNIVITDQGFSVRHNKADDEEEAEIREAVEEEEEDGGPEVPCTDKDGKSTSDCMRVFSGSACIKHRKNMAKCRAAGEACSTPITECVDDAYNYAGLTAYVAEVKATYGKICPYMEGSEDYGQFNPCATGLDEANDLECDRTVIIAPEGNIPYSVLIRAMDAVREEGRRGNARADKASEGARAAMADAGLDGEGIAKALGSISLDKKGRPSPSLDKRIDIPGNRVARKVCQRNTETQKETIGNIEIPNELFPYVVIAGGMARVKGE